MPAGSLHRELKALTQAGVLVRTATLNQRRQQNVLTFVRRIRRRLVHYAALPKYRSINATSFSHGTTCSISARNRARRVVLPLKCLMLMQTGSKL